MTETAPEVTYANYAGVVEISSRKKEPVYDGDTLTLLRDVGQRTFIKTRFRLIGIDTPEKTGSEKEWGKISRTHLLDLIGETKYWWTFTDPWGATFKIPALVSRTRMPDKYGGRWLGEIWSERGKISLNLQMIDDNFARAYDGSKKTLYPLDSLPIQPEVV